MRNGITHPVYISQSVCKGTNGFVKHHHSRQIKGTNNCISYINSELSGSGAAYRDLLNVSVPDTNLLFLIMVKACWDPGWFRGSWLLLLLPIFSVWTDTIKSLEKQYMLVKCLFLQPCAGGVFVVMSLRTSCLSPGLHAWPLVPLLSCDRPLIWVPLPQLWEPPAGTGIKLKERRRWQQRASGGKLARTASLHLSFVQSQAPHLPKLPSRGPYNLQRPHTGSMTSLTPELRCLSSDGLGLGMVDVCFCHQCFL